MSLRMRANDLTFLCADETTQQTPVGPFTGTTIKPKVGLTPILRAGLGMTDALLSLFPYVTGYATFSRLLTYQLTCRVGQQQSTILDSTEGRSAFNQSNVRFEVSFPRGVRADCCGRLFETSSSPSDRHMFHSRSFGCYRWHCMCCPCHGFRLGSS